MTESTHGLVYLWSTRQAMVRRKSVVTPEGALHTLAIDGKCLWSGRREGCAACQVQRVVRVHRVMRALLTSARPRLFLDQRTLEAGENEMGAFEAFWTQLLQTYGQLSQCEVVTLDAGYSALLKAGLIDGAYDGYVLALKDNQSELLREAQRLLISLAARQAPAAMVLERDHGQWVRRSLWRTPECAGWLRWGQRRQVWLVRTEKCVRQTTPRADSVPAEGEDHYYITNLGGKRLDGVGILGVVRGHWGIENNGFRTLDMEWHEERAWCTQGAATDVLGLLWLWAYNLVGLLKGRYLRAPRDRALTLASFGAWLERASTWQAARRRVHRGGRTLRMGARGWGCRSGGLTIRGTEPTAARGVCPRLTADRSKKASHAASYTMLEFFGKVYVRTCSTCYHLAELISYSLAHYLSTTPGRTI